MVSCCGLIEAVLWLLFFPGTFSSPLHFTAESQLLRAMSSAGTVIGKCLETPLGLISKEFGEGNSFAFSDFTLPRENKEDWEGESVKMSS